MQSENFVYVDPECQVPSAQLDRKPLGETKRPLAEIRLRQRSTVVQNGQSLSQEIATVTEGLNKPTFSSTTHSSTISDEDDITCDYSLDGETDDDLYGSKLNDENSFSYGQSVDYNDEDEMMISITHDRSEKSLINFDVSFISKNDEYADDIESYMLVLERTPCLRPMPNCMSKQEDITSTMRSILVDWLCEVSDEYKMHHETVFLAIGMVDRFLSVMHVDRSSFQLLGTAALFSASKYEEIYPPLLNLFSEVTDYSYSTSQILQMEILLLKVIQFRISVPTPYYFLTKIFSSTTRFSQRTYHLALYLCYLTMLEDQPFLEYYPSEIAIAATILATYQLESHDLITDKLSKMFTQSISNQTDRNRTKVTDRRNRTVASERKLPLCIEALHKMQEYAPQHSQKAIYEKFSQHEYDCVANLKPVLDVRQVINDAMQQS